MQLRELRQYVQRQSFQTFAEYVDTGFSGASASRPQLDRLLRDAQLHKFQAVLVWKLDRWGRSVAHCVRSIQELVSLGIRFLSATESIDTGTESPMSKFLLHLFAAFAEMEREIIRERVRAGVRNAKAKGTRLGRPQRVFRRDEVLRLRTEGKSWRQVAQTQVVSVALCHKTLCTRSVPFMPTNLRFYSDRLLGGVTQAIDLHHAVMASLGERFLLYRIAEVDADDLADAALGSVGKEAMMRRELSAAVRSFCECAISPAPLLSPEDRRWLVNLSTLVSRCRSAVERDGYNREIELIPDAEMPGRLARTLAQLFAGLGALRVTSDERRRLIKKTALDCVPSTRRRTLQLLADNGGLLSTTAIASSLGYPSATARRALEDLAAHALVSRESGGQGKADSWSLTAWTTERWREVG